MPGALSGPRFFFMLFSWFFFDFVAQFAAILMGYMFLSHPVPLYAWVFLIVFAPLATVSSCRHRFFDCFVACAAMCMGFKLVFASLVILPARCMGFITVSLHVLLCAWVF